MSDNMNHEPFEPASASVQKELPIPQNQSTMNEPSGQFDPQPTQPVYGGSYGSVPPYGFTPASPVPGPAPKKKRKGKWALRVLAAVLVLVLAAGGGYGGAYLALQNADTSKKVVIQQVTGAATSADTTKPADGTILSSEQVAEKVSPSVVAITTEQMATSNYWFGNYVTSGAGSGVIISADGYILTNNHVIDGADTITVELSNGTSYDATLVGAYANGDIAVVKIDAADLTPVTIYDSDTLKQGASVYAVGNPEGTFSNSITDGIVSALTRTIKVATESGNNGYNYGFPYSNGSSGYITLNVIQFSAAVSPGNSGGGLFTETGALTGIVCAKSSDSDSEGLGFAIPSNTALEIASSLISTGTYEGDGSEPDGNEGNVNTNDAVLGITAAALTQEQAQYYGFSSAGVYVVTITEESTKTAGLKVGDRIISIDKVMVSAVSDVTDYLADFTPGDKVTLNVEREGQMLSLEIELVENTDKQ